MTSKLARIVYGVLLGAASVAGAQSSQQRRPSGFGISGIVYDSIAGSPLAGATVQLVGADPTSHVARTVETDSLGRFSLSDNPAGRYTIGFFHPVLETLGIEPPAKEITLGGEQLTRITLSTPDAEHYRDAVCGASAHTTTPPAILVGVVRDASNLSAVPGAIVTAQWLEMTFSSAGVARRFPRASATTAPNGWFALCELPSPGTIALRASRNSDSLATMDVEVPASGVVRKELYFPPSSGANDAHISGSVLTAEGGRAVAGARVAIIGGPETKTNERGEWTITDAPFGTRTIEVRAIGFYPDRRPVNIIAEPAPVQVRLSTMRSVLDTIKVSANRVAYDEPGFQKRKRSGAGKFLTAQDIAVRGGAVVSDIFRSIPGLKVEADTATGEPKIWMRGPFDYCEPTVFLNGARLPNLHSGDIDEIVQPNQVRAVEIYSEATVPGEFKDFTRMDSCGSIVIWRK